MEMIPSNFVLLMVWYHKSDFIRELIQGNGKGCNQIKEIYEFHEKIFVSLQLFSNSSWLIYVT